MSNCKPQPPLFVQRPRRNHPNYNREYDFEYSNHKNSDHTYTTAFGCVRPTDCPVLFCPVDITTSILPCTCHSPVETVTTTTSCGCAGCGPIYTSILPPTCESSLSCPTVTATAPPQCPPITTAGCITPDCALISTLPIPCGCTGIQTVNECNGKCPTGCETFYTGLGLPCPLTAIEQL
jgi:hypothetical protein